MTSRYIVANIVLEQDVSIPTGAIYQNKLQLLFHICRELSQMLTFLINLTATLISVLFGSN
jgi:hypothetical protein